MSPAPIAASGQQDPQLQTLAKAFEALLLTTQQFICKERILQQKLEYAYDEVSTLVFLNSTQILCPLCLK